MVLSIDYVVTCKLGEKLKKELTKRQKTNE